MVALGVGAVSYERGDPVTHEGAGAEPKGGAGGLSGNRARQTRELHPPRGASLNRIGGSLTLVFEAHRLMVNRAREARELHPPRGASASPKIGRVVALLLHCVTKLRLQARSVDRQYDHFISLLNRPVR